MKKLYFLTLTAFSIIILSSCGGGSNSADQERIAQLEAKIAELQSQSNGIAANSLDQQNESINDDFTSNTDGAQATSKGVTKKDKYIFKDGVGNTWTVKVNNDNTSTFESSNGETYYGTVSIIEGNIIELNFESDIPRLTTPTSGVRVSFQYPVIDLLNGYIYATSSNYDSKNPKNRVKFE